MNRQLTSPFIALAALMVLQCSGVSELAGTKSGSETTNGYVAGFLVDTAGRPVQQAIVTMIPENFDPVKNSLALASRVDITNEVGAYRFPAADTGTFTIEAVQTISRTRAFITGITVAHDTIQVPTGVVRIPGTVKVVLPAGLDSVNGYIYVPGSAISTSLAGARGVLILDSVPAGTIPAVYYAVKNASVQKVIRYDVQVPSADTVTIVNPAWKYSRQLFLNTSTSGADISGNVYNFPVLVRLTGNSFDFSQAKSDGSDIRFAKVNGAVLPYEIERWDASHGSAEIWVKVDTVHAFDSTRSIAMFWGNSDVASASNGATVFDTAAGFKAVYHLNNANDATYDKYNGTNYGATDTAGMIGGAQEFHGNDSIVIPSRMGMPSTVTLSAWAKLEMADSGGAEVVSISDAVLIRMDNVGNGPGLKGSFHYTAAFLDFYYTSAGINLARTGWHYLTYVFDSANSVQTLYLDGAEIAVSNYATPIYYSTTGKSTYIGTHGNDWGYKSPDFDFTGALDEIRVCRIARSQNWIKLCYMNQKAEDQLVVFK
jgi:hypothetical protein